MEEVQHWSYVLAPLCGYLASGVFKRLLHRASPKHFGRASGLGGFPSTHNAVAWSTAFTIGFVDGFGTPVFSIALAFSFLVFVDAVDLRMKLGQNGRRLNQLMARLDDAEKTAHERLGHTVPEAIGGVCLGFVVAVVLLRAGALF